MTCFIIAEIGVNHNGSMDMARELIDVAAEAGADAVKFQTFFADELVTPNARKAEYQVANTGDSGSQYAMLKALELTEAQFAGLADHCKATGVEFLSTPFSEAASDLLARVGVRAFKISSGDLTHLPMLAHIAAKGLPILLSTGMGNMSEVEAALDTIAAHGAPEVSLLHCVSNYPADAADCNLAAMDTLARAFGVPVGWSDHTEGAEISFAAVARGARLIEKHITLDKTLPGPDHLASMEAVEFGAFVQGIRTIEAAIGDGHKRPTAAELKTAEVARRSIVVVRDLPEGHVLRAEDLRVMRPGTGLKPALLGMVTGLPLACDIAAFTPLTEAHLHG
ncbi:N-acetylneuraminate synthase [Rhodovulum imhoffii]|uniref:N-acetylneuraminate synthase n=1 Tax=Rhodovulum imhoffii TaxID=365340 RepID=A0A2T5BTY0_9RHOB|nr:N-acetylneuraminate synthase [Rhodovulum imhoffii]MBK5932728.1 N-acetylneuraminate synthase [Rhodovulum imhoffii]PTN02934.1 N-acetylneuraminate synthase [Rhodovulum imhoffii]